jgi:hypothetical protein
MSPVAWQHINMVGQFEFFKNKQNIDLDQVTKGLTEDLKKGQKLFLNTAIMRMFEK